MKRIASLSSPCSAWARRSAATRFGVGAGVGDRHDLAGAGGQVDPDAACDEELAGGDVRAARPDHRIDRGDRLGAVRERSDGLGAADGVHLGHPELARRDEDRVGRARRYDGDAPHPRDERRHGGHHERGRQCRASAGDAQTDRVERKPAALGDDSRSRFHARVGRSLRGTEQPHRLDHPAERGEDLVVDDRRLDRGRVDAKTVGARPVQPLGPLEQRGIATRPDVRDDRRDDLQGLVEQRTSHGTSLSTGRTRIDVPPPP